MPADSQESALREIARYTIEIAVTGSERERGLSGRVSLRDDAGMLFPLHNPAETSFWMSGMLFPIDILFFSREGSLIQVLPSLQVCTECPLHPAPDRALYALEVNAGHALRFGFLPGDMLVIRRSVAKSPEP